jgi:hypothetical protein
MASYRLSSPAGVVDYAETPALHLDPSDMPKPKEYVEHPISPLSRCEQGKVWEDLDKYEPPLKLNKLVYGWVSDKYYVKKFAGKYVVIYDRLKPNSTALCAFQMCKHEGLTLNVPIPLAHITLCKPPQTRQENKYGFDLIVAAKRDQTILNVLTSKVGLPMDPHIRTAVRTQDNPSQKIPQEGAAAAASASAAGLQYEGYEKYKAYFEGKSPDKMEKQFRDFVGKMNDKSEAEKMTKSIERRMSELNMKKRRGEPGGRKKQHRLR